MDSLQVDEGTRWLSWSDRLDSVSVPFNPEGPRSLAGMKWSQKYSCEKEREVSGKD